MKKLTTGQKKALVTALVFGVKEVNSTALKSLKAMGLVVERRDPFGTGKWEQGLTGYAMDVAFDLISASQGYSWARTTRASGPWSS